MHADKRGFLCPFAQAQYPPSPRRQLDDLPYDFAPHDFANSPRLHRFQIAGNRILRGQRRPDSGKIMRGKIIKTGNRALYPLCEPPFDCEILDKGQMRPMAMGLRQNSSRRRQGGAAFSRQSVATADAPPHFSVGRRCRAAQIQGRAAALPYQGR
jgi:hypothetical protein